MSSPEVMLCSPSTSTDEITDQVCLEGVRVEGTGKQRKIELTGPHSGIWQPTQDLLQRGRGWLERQPRWLAAEPTALIALALTGLLFEFILIHSWLGSLSIAGHQGFPVPGQDPLTWILDDGSTGLNRFLFLVAALFLPYLLGLALAARVRGRGGVAVAFGGAALFGGTFLAVFPAGAIDIFHNIMDGRLTWVYHLNPMLVPPSAVKFDPLFAYLNYWQMTRSAYGPLWFLTTLPAVVAGGNSLNRNIVAFKALPFAFELIGLGLSALIVQRIAPRKVAAAIVCFGWNPLVLWEIAGNGHNDIVMMTFVLLAIFLLLTERWPLAFPALACSVLVKYVSIVLLPVFVLWVFWQYGLRAWRSLALASLVSIALAVIVFLPFWQGSRTLEPLRQQPNYFIFSPASAALGRAGDNLANTSGVVRLKEVMTAAFAVFYALALARLRRDPASLIRTCVEVMFLWLVFMAWWFWPWYVLWGLILAALLPGGAHARLFVIFSATAMFVYTSSVWREALWNYSTTYAMAIGSALLIFSPPVLYALLHVSGYRRACSPLQEHTLASCCTAVEEP
jgi:alpha-1,6-mannosyltransferase